MTTSPSDPAGSASLSPDEAFSLLGNDTRVGILQALWDAFESGTGDNAVPFSVLFEQVAIRDTGNFTYHLEKLTGPFVRRTDGGYELTQTGINIVRAVRSGTVIDDPAFGPTPIDITCPRCDAAVEVVYADELLTAYCTACEGVLRWNDDPGFLVGGLVPPAVINDRTVDAAFHAGVTYIMHQIAAFHDGVCPHCSSPPDITVNACPDHHPGSGTLCPTCDRHHLAEVWMVCSTCKRSMFPPVKGVVLTHPAVTVFYHTHGITHRFATWDTLVRSFDVREELVSADPLQLRVTIPAAGDELHLTVDGDMTVVDITS